MADFEESIKGQPGGAFGKGERQGLRFFLERDLTRERFKQAAIRYLTWIGPALAAAVAATQLYKAFFGG